MTAHWFSKRSLGRALHEPEHSLPMLWILSALTVQ